LMMFWISVIAFMFVDDIHYMGQTFNLGV